MKFLRSSPVFLGFTAFHADCFEQSRFEMNDVPRFVTLKFIPHLRVGYAPGFPAAIHLLESRSCKSLFGLIAENEVGFRQQAVLPFVPRFADGEIPKEVVRGIRTKGNRDQRFEVFPGLVEVRIGTREVQETKFGKFTEER